MKNKILILVNTGTPDSADVKDVRRYLSEFLNDKNVIDLPWLFRKILVNLIIVPFRAKKSAGLYKRLWTGNGSPLRIHLKNLVSKVQVLLGEEYLVIGAMRYGNPSLSKILSSLKHHNPERVTIFPLFPQYASSTTGSVNEMVIRHISMEHVNENFYISDQFYSNPVFIEAMLGKINKYKPLGFQHVLFSYHGLPLRHIQKIHPSKDCLSCNCDREFPVNEGRCYRATCYETTRLLSARLGLDPEKVSTAFQSRLSKNWLSPFTDAALKELAKKGIKRVLVVAPSFVADCLETTIEIGEDYLKLFVEAGGEELVLVDSLNDDLVWAEAIVKIASA